MGDITLLASRTNSARDVTPELCLRECLQDAIKSPNEYNKLLVLWIDDTDGSFDVGFTNAGLKCSEILAALEIMRSKTLGLMGYGECPP